MKEDKTGSKLLGERLVKASDSHADVAEDGDCVSPGSSKVLVIKTEAHIAK